MASPNKYQPGLAYIAPISRTWATTGNTDTVTDVNITNSTAVVIIHTGVPAGFWKVVVTPTTVNGATLTAGSFTVTSSDAEQSGLTYSYKYL